MKKVYLFIYLVIMALTTNACGSQSPVYIPDSNGLVFRNNVNNAFQAVTTKFSGNNAPFPTYAFMEWVDTSATPAVLKIRDANNASWIIVANVNTSTTSFTIPNTVPYTGASSDIDAGTHEITAKGVALSSRAADSAVVHNTGNENIAGVKNLTDNLKVDSANIYTKEIDLRENQYTDPSIIISSMYGGSIGFNGGVTNITASGLYTVGSVTTPTIILLDISTGSCNSSLRGYLVMSRGGTGVKDSVSICAKDGSNNYAWRTIY